MNCAGHHSMMRGDYKAVEWIDTGPITSSTYDAGAVIDTGIKIDSNCEIECEIYTFDSMSGNFVPYGVFFGSSNGGPNNDTNCVAFGNDGYGNRKRCYSMFLSNGAIFHEIIQGRFATVRLNNNALYIDNVYQGAPGEGSRYNNSNYTLTIGCRNSAGTHWRCSRSRYKSFSISRNGVKILNLSPVVRKSDGAYGMIDTISKNFFQSVNTHPILGPQQ